MKEHVTRKRIGAEQEASAPTHTSSTAPPPPPAAAAPSAAGPSELLLGARGGGGLGCGAGHSRSSGGSLLLEHSPVKGVVILMMQSAEQNAEQLPQIHVVWSLIKTQSPAVVEIHGKLCWEALSTRNMDYKMALIAYNIQLGNNIKITYSSQHLTLHH